MPKDALRPLADISQHGSAESTAGAGLANTSRAAEPGLLSPEKHEP